MKCTECPYYWRENDEKYPCCHHSTDLWYDIAPCEQEELDKQEEEEADFWDDLYAEIAGEQEA